MATRYSTGVYSRLLGKNGTDTGADGLRGIFTNCVIDFYSGAQVASPDDPPPSGYLGSVTIAGGAFTPGSPTNGLNFGAPVGTVLSKAVAEDWKFKGTAAGVIASYRIKGNAADNNLTSTTLPRIDGTVGTTSGDMQVGNVNSTIGGYITIDTYTVTGSNPA